MPFIDEARGCSWQVAKQIHAHVEIEQPGSRLGNHFEGVVQAACRYAFAAALALVGIDEDAENPAVSPRFTGTS